MRRAFRGSGWYGSYGDAANLAFRHIPLRDYKVETIIVSQASEFKPAPEPYNRDMVHWARFVITVVVETEETGFDRSRWGTVYEQYEEVPCP